MVILKYDSYVKHQKFLNEAKNDTQDDPNNLLQQETKKDVSRCVALILTKYPFFGEYLIDCRFLYDHPDIDTMATDGHNIFICSKFAAGLSDEEMIFILCHEILHIMLLHHLRMRNMGADPRKWNYAADLELNPMLVNDGLLTAEQVKNDIKGLYDEKYIGMSAETIYDQLGADKSQPDPNNDYPAQIGDIIRTKDGKWGQISQINADGTYEFDEKTEDEARKILNQ